MKNHHHFKTTIYSLFAILFLSCSPKNINDCANNGIGLIKDNLLFSSDEKLLIANGYGNNEECNCFFKIDQIDAHMVSCFLYINDNRIDSLFCSITYNGTNDSELTKENKLQILDSVAKRNFIYDGVNVMPDTSGLFTHLLLQWGCTSQN